ncbi:MAG: YifB family Mg chelatase-like AAA ATPase [Syntrophobacteraceae bacterium]|nr:YifB family Mg chelatase-like AAA ATPase [Syntrophobacteraceae bacterium]
MIAKTYTCSLLGIDAVLVEVEVDIASGLPGFSTVGLPDSIVKESKDRVKAAIQNSGYPFPFERITVNLAPAALRKEGAGFDLPIAVGILSAIGIVSAQRAEKMIFCGELALDGRVKPVAGCLPMAIRARDSGFDDLILPGENAREAAVLNAVSVRPANHLCEVVEYLNGRMDLPAFGFDLDSVWQNSFSDEELDFEDVKGQEHAKRGLEVAAAGNHNVLLIGPPGSGKTMLAQRISGILPALSFEEALETSKVYSVAGMLSRSPLIVRRQFRAPHHSISDAGLVGGGQIPRPGEVSLSHNGVLFLDEFPEFRRNVLDLLRQPLEDGQVTIARAAIALTYPASFMLIGAMNPCPCGYSGDPIRPCTCSPNTVMKYRGKISGPILDRIDLHIEVPSVKYEQLRSQGPSEKSSAVRERVSKARQIQLQRLPGEGIYSNSRMKPKHLKKFCRLDAAGQSILDQAVVQLGLSARAYHRILKVSRTLADLEEAENIGSQHLLEAIQYRSLDRRLF